MTQSEFIDWVAYLKMEDEKFQKWEWYAAQIPLVIAEAHHVKGMKLKDFTLDGNKPVKTDPANVLKALAAAFGGKITPAKPEG